MSVDILDHVCHKLQTVPNHSDVWQLIYYLGMRIAGSFFASYVILVQVHLTYMIVYDTENSKTMTYIQFK